MEEGGVEVGGVEAGEVGGGGGGGASGRCMLWTATMLSRIRAVTDERDEVWQVIRRQEALIKRSRRYISGQAFDVSTRIHNYFLPNS